MIIDGKDMILGRVATFAAKRSLLGEKVDIINCEEMIITGGKRNVINKYKRKKSMGVPSKGPFQPRLPDMFVRKVVRGMVPYKQPKGRDAYKRVKCYIGSPAEIKGEPIKLENASSDKVPNLRFIKVKEICKELGWQN
jgi:large subunit ribosomal protein L13|tara:strand:- start:116 stop:529 length:414 start_codon:yes stop_codon:yes gene_type:complete